MDNPGEQTIVGLSTPPGTGGISIIRASGPLCPRIAQAIFTRNAASFPENPMPGKNYHGWIKDGEVVVDEVLLCLFKAPRSYTGEDTLEINCHGGYYVAEKITELILAQGATLSKPGEFTRRAFMNGKIDLSKAEAVHELIHAKSPLMAEISANNLKGALFEEIRDIQRKVAESLALINAEIDFADENQSFVNHRKLAAEIKWVKGRLSSLSANAQKGIYLNEGFNIALAGRPNAGKSSIMNGLLKKERSIVTEIPGTTRDIVEDMFLIQGLPIKIVDTAGIRETDDVIEKEGIRRAKEARLKADLILWIVDQTRPNWGDYEELAESERPMLLVLNKTDLAQASVEGVPNDLQSIETCSKKDPDIEKLKSKIREFAFGNQTPSAESCMITNLRQKKCVEKAICATENVLTSLDEKRAEEIVGYELNEMLQTLGEIVGETTPDDLLDHIFQNFCIGK